MKTAFHRIRTSDNLELDGLLYEPDTKTDKVLVHIHGMAGNFYDNKFMDEIAETLTSNNIAFAVFNNRGAEFFKVFKKYVDGVRDPSIKIGSAYEMFEESPLDVGACIDFVKKNNFKEIHLSGHSLGGPKIVYYMNKKKDARIKSLLLLSPADMIGLAKVEDSYEGDIKIAREMVSNGKSGELMPELIWDEHLLSSDTFLGLSEEGRDVGVLNFYDSDDKLVALSNIKIPMITIMGKKDFATVIPVEDMMQRIKKVATASSKVETVVLGDADHGYKDYEQKLADVVLSWIKTN